MMDRRLFMGTLLGGTLTAFLLNKKKDTNMRMPSLFIGHGSPMNAIEQNEFTSVLQKLSLKISQPKAILVISAHWETQGTKVLKVDKNKTIHDFGGFPKELYQIQYPAPSDASLADDIIKLVKHHKISSDENWGLDHGTWTVLKHIYPNADIPVLQLSLNQSFTFKDHLELARELKPLRDEGILIIGSGNITHNLQRLVWSPNSAPVDWAFKFDEMIKRALQNRDENVLLNVSHTEDPLWSVCHPTFEHYLPLLYAYGVTDDKERPNFIFEGFQLGSLSMRSILFS